MHGLGKKGERFKKDFKITKKKTKKKQHLNCKCEKVVADFNFTGGSFSLVPCHCYQ